MKRALLVLAAMTVFLGGCGNDEAPKMKKAEESKAMQESPAPMEQKAEPAAPMSESAPMTEAAPSAESTAMSGESTGESMPAAGTTQESMAATESKPEAGMTTAAAEGGNGKKTYDSVCFACHAMGVAGAPKFGDKEAWAPRIAQGKDTLYSHAINGFQGKSGVMPAKGGRPDLSDADVKAAVDYIVENGQ